MAAFANASGGALKDGESLLFYVPAATSAVSCEIRVGGTALRMEPVYAALAVGEESGLYFSYPADPQASCLAIGESEVKDVENVTAE